jgi:hypothetical protein
MFLIKFYKIIAPLMPACGSKTWALNRSESKKTEAAEMRFLRRVSGHTLTDHVLNTTMRNALQMYALEERVQGSRSKWRNHFLRMDCSGLTQEVKNYQPNREDMLDDREDNGRIVSEI